MGAVNTTGLKFQPPNIQILSMSNSTGLVNDIIQINGINFDYVDSIKFNNTINCVSSFNSLTDGNFRVPFDGNTGYVNVHGDFITLTGTSPKPFWTMFEITNFSPNLSPSGEQVNFQGIHFNTLTGINFQAEVIKDDCNFLLSGSNPSFFDLQNGTTSGNAEAVFIQNINTVPEQINTYISKKQNFDLISGNRFQVKFTTTPQNNIYENHILSFKTGNYNTGQIQIFTNQINQGLKTKRINLLQNINQDYCPFTSVINTGNDICYSYISGKDTSGFYINFNKTLNYSLDLNVLTISGSQINNNIKYKTTSFTITSGEINNLNLNYKINYNNNKLYAPYILTSMEYYNLSYPQDSGYLYNISNMTNKNFDLDPLGSSGVYNAKFNVLNIYNELINYNNFITTGDDSFYQKIYLIPGQENNLLTPVSSSDLNISGTINGSGTCTIPKSDYYINGPVVFLGLFGYERKDFGNFKEIPDPISVTPSGINTQGSVIISGRSFKKANLIDGTGEYNSIIVKFRNITNPKQKNDFLNTFYLIDDQTLSGTIQLGSYLTGLYVIQALTEDGEIYE